MSRSTANVSFYCRESKKNKDGLAPIELVIILNTRRCFIQLPRKDVALGEVIGEYLPVLKIIPIFAKNN